MPPLSDLAACLAGPLDAARYHAEGDPAGVWIASDRPVRRLGLRLEAGRAPYGWIPDDVDALLVHRPFGLWPAQLPAGVGVLAVHRALDDLVWTSPALSEALGLRLDPEPLLRDGATIGNVGQIDGDVEVRLASLLGGHEATAGEQAEGPVGRVAIVGAMTEALVLEAAARGARLYVTGQMRKPAAEAVRQTGVRVVAVGQARSEWWGLRRVGALLAEAFPGLEVVDLSGDKE